MMIIVIWRIYYLMIERNESWGENGRRGMIKCNSFVGGEREKRKMITIIHYIIHFISIMSRNFSLTPIDNYNNNHDDHDEWH